jgi:hypothetical protein
MKALRCNAVGPVEHLVRDALLALMRRDVTGKAVIVT